MNSIVQDFQRDLPHDLTLEQQVLGAILVNNEAYERVSSTLGPEMFFEPVHARIYEAVGNALKAGLVASPVTLQSMFQHDLALTDVGGASYLARLAGASVAIVACVDYAKVVRNLYLRRCLIEFGEKIIEEGFQPGLDNAKRIIADAEQELFTLGNAVGGQRSIVGMNAVADGVADIVRAAKANPGGATGLSSGIKALDRLTGGFIPGGYDILGGRPSMGKTALALCIARNVARQGRGVIFESQEMPNEQLGLRLASMLGYSSTTPVPYSDVRKGVFNAHQWTRFEEALEQSRDLPIYIDDQRGRSVSAIRMNVRRAIDAWQRQGIEPGMLIVDYLQLLTASDRYKSQRVNEVDEISKGLREIAKEFGISVLVLSQLNRAVEQRDDKRPVMSDLRDSGALEQDADTIFFCYREYYYAKDRKNVDQDWLASIENKATVIIAKQRNGPTRDVELFFDAPHGLWSDLY